MATSQQQQFAQTYGPYAQQAGSRLGVDPNIILGQWGIESGWHTPSTGNLAGISPGGRLASYSSPQAFTDSYVTTIQHNFPNATNTGSDASAFNQGLVNGTYGVYYQGNEAASRGLRTPTQGDQNAYLASLQTAQNNNLVQYSSGEAPNTGTTLASNTPDTSGQGYGSNGTSTTGGGGASYTDPTTLQTYTATPGSSSITASGPGYGTAVQVGVESTLLSDLNTWIGGIKTSIGNWMTNLLGYAFGSVANWFARIGLIILGFILLMFALWRILDPSGEKTKAVAEHVAAAA